ncbi:MAG: homoserine dehydrogenase [Candidatus Omnitrophica bacterium]|nr:homoserine dehydrogenase [Candidatus Omnitrophota bacterium]
MNKINIGLLGYGIVGSGVIKMLGSRRAYFREKYGVVFEVKAICDLRFKDKRPLIPGMKTRLTTDASEIIQAEDIDVVVELIGGLHPAKEFVEAALDQGKHVITANKALIAHFGQALFERAQKNQRSIYFETSVLAGVPVIRPISEGLAGNTFNAIYGIVNGTCNFILSEMTRNHLSFADALQLAQKNGFAEADPTLDISGGDSAHKLAVLTALAFGKFLPVKQIYTEGITDISYDDIDHAESLGLVIKLLTIAKKSGGDLEARVHPTLIPKDHPLALINGVYNAVYLDADPLGKVLISGEGAGQMAAASGVVSDLVNLATRSADRPLLCNLFDDDNTLKYRTIDAIESKFYIRFMAMDQPGVLSKITGILGRHQIGINSVAQKAHNKAQAVPVIMLTDYTTEKSLRVALTQIRQLSVIKSKPVAIRMEKLQ